MKLEVRRLIAIRTSDFLLPTFKSPQLLPRLPAVLGGKRDDSVHRKLTTCCAAADEQREQAREMREMSRDEDVARFATEPIADPLRRVVRLKIARCGKVRERVARAPESFGRLFRAQLPTVPHH